MWLIHTMHLRVSWRTFALFKGDESAVAAINKAITDIMNKMKQVEMEEQEEEDTQKTATSNENEVQEVNESRNQEESSTEPKG